MTLVALALAAVLQTTPPVAEAVAHPSKAAGSPVICRREVVTGSNKRVRVCRSQAATDTLTFDAKRKLDARLQNGARTSATRAPGYVPSPRPGG